MAEAARGVGVRIARDLEPCLPGQGTGEIDHLSALLLPPRMGHQLGAVGVAVASLVLIVCAEGVQALLVELEGRDP